MNNTWKYASLGERERLGMIKDGNSDVYNTEKARNKELKQLRADLGLSTDDIDNWDSIIDSANAAANDKYKVKGTGLPKTQSGRAGQATMALNSYLKGLKSDYIHDQNEAVEKAEDEANYVAEFFANNGYSEDGSKAQKEQKKIADELSYVLDVLKREYESASQKARQSFLTQLRNSIK